PLADALVAARETTARALEAVRAVPPDAGGDVAARRERALKAATSLVEDLDLALAVPESHVAWVAGSQDFPALTLTAIDVAGVLAEGLWSRHTAVLTSATIPPNLGVTLGLDAGRFDELDVGSPFDYEHHALLYCA